jgi:two-component system sensor histidine kinase YcbA
LSLWICDAIPNIIEASVRKAWEIAEFDQLVITIIIVGVIRTILTLTVYYLTRYYTERLKRSEREKYYREIVVFISKLKTELFLLNKSRNDIENAVSYIHECYDELKDENSMKKPLLKIAKDIHEIKKDYLRVIAGMNGVFKIDTNIKYMNIKNIFYIIKDNCEKLIESKGKNIIVNIDYNYIFETEEFYSIISILNNLTINSIDSINLNGKISIMSHIEMGEVIFIVEDSGGGVPKEKIDIIFKSGYTTKYDEHTGKMSTGLGLSHVKNIVEEYFKGSIRISSEVGNGTKFVIRIPRNRIVKEDDNL